MLAQAAGLAGLAAAPAIWATSAAPAPRWNDAPDATRARLLDRITWGCTAQGAQGLGGMPPETYLASQLRPAPVALPAAAQAEVDAMVISRTPVTELAARMEASHRATKALPTESARQEALQAWQQAMRQLQREASHRSVLRALYSPSQLHEKMTWFWVNHFNVFAGKGALRALVGDYENQAIRPHALGRFRTLLGATARHAAMLRYLDNAQNAAGRINENYARELMELHTLGVNGGYGQQDVQELARVLTGVGVALRAADEPPPRIAPALRAHYRRDGLFEFHPQRHDWNPKTLLGEPLQAQGLAELDEALDRLARAPATARHVTRKMALFLVGEQPGEALLNHLARTFQRTDGDIPAVLHALLQAPEFAASLGQRFRDPMQYVMAGLRLVHGEQVAPGTEVALTWLQRLAQPLFGRATPDGYPMDAASWSGSGQMSARFDVARALGAGMAGVEPGAGMAAVRDAPPPRLADTPYVRSLEPTLGRATRDALAQARSPREWNLLFLSSPEFMLG